MDEELKRISDRDQHLAALADVARDTALYHKALIDSGMPCDLANTLIRDWHYLAWYAAQIRYMRPEWWRA